MGKKSSMPEVLDSDIEGKDTIVELLERGLELKILIGKAPDPDEGVEGSGLLREQHENKETLAQFATENGLEGLRHGKLVFTHSLRDGRNTIKGDKLMEALLARGVSADVIRESIAAATVQGDSYWVRQIDVLK